jgi:hypothetical protein
MSDTITLTPEEQYKYAIITKVISKAIKPGYAAKLLELSPRQVRNLKYAVQANGSQGVVHKLKGRISNHHIPITTKENALDLIEKNYPDFHPTFATEKLGEIYGIHIYRGTTRLWMMEEGLWVARKQKKEEHRSWRPRKEYYGEMQQFDGSYHLWFEKRYCDRDGNPIEVCLLAAIDEQREKL